MAQPQTPGARFGPYRPVSFDGCSSLKAPDTASNRVRLGSAGYGGYPLLELMTLVETGTRAMIGTLFGPTAEGETGHARWLLHLLTPDMLVLWNKGVDGNDFLAGGPPPARRFWVGCAATSVPRSCAGSPTAPTCR